MCRVLAAAVAELLELETASGRLLVLRRRVVPLLAIRALQCHDFTHLSILPYWVQPASTANSGFPLAASPYSNFFVPYRTRIGGSRCQPTLLCPGAKRVCLDG
jgi:hypothetical protein